MTTDDLCAELVAALRFVLRVVAVAEETQPAPRLAAVSSLVRARARQALELAEAPRDDPTEEVVRALMSVADDVACGRGCGVAPVVSEATWGRVVPLLRRYGVAVPED